MARLQDLNANAKFGITLQPVGGKPGTSAANPVRMVLRRAGLAATLPDHSPFTPHGVSMPNRVRDMVPPSTRMAARSLPVQVKQRAQQMQRGIFGFFRGPRGVRRG